MYRSGTESSNPLISQLSFLAINPLLRWPEGFPKVINIMKDTFPLLSQEFFRNFSFRISVPETGQRPYIYGFIINHNITDSTNQNQSRILSRRMRRTGLHMPKIDWKARGRGRGLEPVKRALYDSSSSSEATGGPNRSWPLAGGTEGSTAHVLSHCNVAFLLLGLALTLGPECDTVRVSGQILMLGPCEWLTPAPSLLMLPSTWFPKMTITPFLLL